MQKKYELTDETVTAFRGLDNCKTFTKLHRIRALVDIPEHEVRQGNLGGFIESEKNLSHEGSCWVGQHARVYDDAIVSDNACVFGYANVYDNATVHGEAYVYDNAHICGHANVYGKIKIYDDAIVCGTANVSRQPDILWITGIGFVAIISNNRTITFYKCNDGGVGVSQINGSSTLDEFIDKVNKMNETYKYRRVYTAAIELAKQHILT